MVAAQRVETDAGIVQILGIERTGVDVGLAATVNRITDRDHHFDPLVDELLIDLLDDVRCAGVGVFTVVSNGPLGIGDDAKFPRGSRCGCDCNSGRNYQSHRHHEPD